MADVVKQKNKKPMSGITTRWLKNTLSVIAVILVIFSIMFILILKDYYFSTVDMKLSSQYSNSVASFFANYTGGTDERFEAGAREYVNNFSQKDVMEVWVIDADGKVVISSSGFDIVDQDIPDFKQALINDSRSATFSGRDADGESVRAETFLLPTVNGEETGAVRYIISTQNITTQMIEIFFLIFALFLIIIALITLSGLYFVGSIVRPVNEINDIANKIAAGDLNARTPPQEYNDEISELAENINHMAEEISSSDKMKNDFISTVSHEMKTPLTAIKGWGETMLDMGDSDPELTKRGLEVIINESGRLTNVVNDLLDLSRIVNGRLALRTDKIDALAELDETIFVFKDRSMREGIELNYNAPHNPAPMVGDADRLKQVFVNVLDNAFKYSQQGGKVDVIATIESVDGDEKVADLIITIVDNGCGISEEDLPKVKNKFYKSNISVKGSGIGLAVCEEIVSMHGGVLDIASEIDVGTTVTITLPIEYIEVVDNNSLPKEIIEEVIEEKNEVEEE